MRLLQQSLIKTLLLPSIFIFTIVGSLRADEGMWMVQLVGKNIETMQKLGLKLTADDIYNINKSSLKDAVVSLDDGGCTGEIISAKGLVLTNHHCGVGDIQYHSSIERNLIEDGFWAMSLKEELHVPGKTALVLLRVEDVTKRVLSLVDTLAKEDVFFDMVNNALNQIQNETQVKEKGTHAKVVPMFNHNNYYLFVYHRFTDVRLVGAPPASIGNFGGDVDNWHWPRHTGDFCLYRIYSGPDGLPADYSSKNIPYTPKHHFPVSLQGVNEGDFAMIIGYPGTTHRFATSFQALHSRDVVAPWIDEVWGSFIQSIKDEMKRNPAVKVKYTDTHDGLVNFYQKETWQAKSMFRFGVVEKMIEREKNLYNWAQQDSARYKNITQSLPGVESYYAFIQERNYEELFRSLSALISWPVGVGTNIHESLDLIVSLTDPSISKRKIKKITKQTKKRVPQIFENYFPELDAELYAQALYSTLNNLPDTINDPVLGQLKRIDALHLVLPIVVQSFYQKSYFTSPQRFNQFLSNPSIDSLMADPIFYLHITFEDMISKIQTELIPYNHNFQYAMRTFTKGMIQMEPDRLHYPDANSTMRVSYGKVIGYKPSDGVSYRPITYMSGMMEKEDQSVDVFKIHPKLKQLWIDKDYGQYANSSQLPVCFITDNDITNGNSGSPVLNADGHLIGVAFDGNHEAMSCDYAYEPDVQRTIIADIRYVLFVIDKFAGAKHLVEEMTIVK